MTTDHTCPTCATAWRRGVEDSLAVVRARQRVLEEVETMLLGMTLACHGL